MSKIIKSSRPNGHYIAIVELDNNWGYDVVIGNDDYEFDTLAGAEEFYEEQRADLAKTPNWEAQASYDEQWGEPFYDPRHSDY